MKYMTVVIAILAMGCTDNDAAADALRSQGLTNIQLTGYSPFSCSDDDFSSTGFDATNPAGKVVSGVVCCGMLFKSCTVRW